MTPIPRGVASAVPQTPPLETMKANQSTVYMVNARADRIAQGFMTKLEMILNAAQLDTMFSAGDMVVIKVQIGDVGNTAYLRPTIIRALVEKVMSLKGKPLVVDTVPFGSWWQSGLDWFNVATTQGFDGTVFDAEVQLADGYTGLEGDLFVAGGQEMGKLRVARIIKEAKAVLVVSHVTGHPLAGLGGALVGVGHGCLALEGKEQLHEVLTPRLDEDRCDECGQCASYCQENAWIMEGERVRLAADRCTGCGDCLAACPQGAIGMDEEAIEHFQKRIAEAGVAVMRGIGSGNGELRFLNFLLDVRPQPDYYPFSDNPFVPNLGVLMADDPVAIDQASLDLIDRAPGLPVSAAEACGVLEAGEEKLPAIVGVDPSVLIRYAEEIRLGQRQYELLIAP